MSEKRPTMALGTVLVVGGCGFLGWHIVDQLLSFPSETDPSAALPKITDDARFKVPLLGDRYPRCVAKVAVVDLRTTNNRLPGAQYYDGDITSVDSMMEVFRRVKPDIVIHTASPSMLEGNKSLLRKVNVDGTKTLLEVAGGEHGNWGGKCKAFVYTSSSSVVHDTQSNLVNVDEEWPYVRGEQQLEYYSETKVCGCLFFLGSFWSILTKLGGCRRTRPEVQPRLPLFHGDLRRSSRRYLRRKRHHIHP